MDCSLPGSSVHGLFQARVLEWAATGVQPVVGSRDSLGRTALGLRIEKEDSKAERLEAHYNWFMWKVNKTCDIRFVLTTEATGTLSNR